VRALLPEVEAAAGNNEAFGFAGNSYNVLGQELIAHGHEAEGRAVLQRAADWFARNAAYAEGNTTAMVRWVHTLIELGRLDEARERSERLMARVPAEARAIGLVGRVAAREGRQDDVARILRVLEALPAEDLQGASTYERAAITANLGASRWEEAVQLFELSIRQGMGFDIRARAHFFTDWRGLRDFAPLQQALRPRG
jgi:hypothetical protein